MGKTHRFTAPLTTRNPFYRQAILTHLLDPLLADLGENGDITTCALFPAAKKIRAVFHAKQDGRLAGIDELRFFLKRDWATPAEKKLFGDVEFITALPDGASIFKGAVLGVLVGTVRDVLLLERTFLNFLQHMCGVATYTAKFVEQCRKYPVLICSTRKTPWGLLDKRACVIGGAGTHRLNLSDAILVKDTHLDLLHHDFNLLRSLIDKTNRLGRFVEIEVESEADGLIASGVLGEIHKKHRIPCFLMLDNMLPESIKLFLKKLTILSKKTKFYIEASGGVTLKNIAQYARCGVDVVSVGAITNSAPALDISLKIVPDSPER